MADPRVSVLVASRDDTPSLRKSLAIVRGQADSIAAEVVLALNVDESVPSGESKDALAVLVDRLVFEREPGKSNALNRGLEACRGEVVAFTDDDALPEPGWLEAITAPLLAAGDEPVGCGGPVEAVYPAGGPPAWYRSMVDDHKTHFLGPCHDHGAEPSDYTYDEDGGDAPLGANCAYRRSLLGDRPYRTDLGPNSATGIRGGEDTELGLRLMVGGHRLLYVPGALVRHPVVPERMSLPFVIGAYRIHGVEAMRMRRHLGFPLPTIERARRKIRLHKMRHRIWRVLVPAKGKRHRARLAYYGGVLEELSSGGAETAPAPREPARFSASARS